MRKLEQQELQSLPNIAKQARADFLHMTTLSGSGHPGGSMSCIDILLTLYHMAKHDCKNPHMADRDRIVISNGHISPGVYTALGTMGYLNCEDAISEFRLAGSIFEGHVERFVPGVEWTTGNLGQGLSAGCGFALASRINKIDYHTCVLMGDGEQQKGQISEARRLAVKFNLNNLTAIIDYNELQISGSIHKVMPQNIKENWESDGWKVIDINGHNFEQIHNAIIQALESEQPCMILAHTVMGKGVSFMENQYKYHGSTLNETQLAEALIELGCENRLEYYRQMRQAKKTAGMAPFCCLPELKLDYDLGKPIVYEKDTDNRSAWGKAIADLAALNQNNSVPLVVFDCDLQSSVKTADFEKVNPERFIQSGIMEQNTAVASGAMSICNIQTWWADFGMFGIDEVYNAQRLNDINHANLKVVTTHVGMDVGEDGRTHQCIDYIGLARNLYNFRLLCPADPNQTDRIIRFAANSAGNHFITMGRSVLPIITNEAGNIYYDADYVFEYGKADLLRNGNSCAIIVTGTPIGRAMQAVDKLRADGVSLQLWYVATPLELDPMMLQKAAATGCIISIEDHNVNSGLGSIIADRLIANGLSCKLTKLGVTEYPISGTSDDVFKWAGLDRDSLIVTIKKHLS